MMGCAHQFTHNFLDIYKNSFTILIMKTYKVDVYDDGTKKWYLNGERHREDGPAVEFADGTKFWYLNGKCHREDGPAVEWADGSKYWYLNGKLHREDGPAVEWANGTKHWFLNDKLHREDGPAIECAAGTKHWYLNGEELSEAEFNARTKPAPSCEGKVVEVDGVKYKLTKA